MKHGKKYVDSAKLVDRNTLYEVNDALELVVKTGKAKFDETVEVHIKLGVDSRHADQQVRGAVVLPNGTACSCSPRATRRRRRRMPEPNLSAPRIWSRRSRAAGWISTW